MIANQQTLQKTYGLSDERLFNVFFKDTPSGKATKRVLETFGLEAHSVIKTVEHGENVNFNIRVARAKVRNKPVGTVGILMS